MPAARHLQRDVELLRGGESLLVRVLPIRISIFLPGDADHLAARVLLDVEFGVIARQTGRRLPILASPVSQAFI